MKLRDIEFGAQIQITPRHGALSLVSEPGRAKNCFSFWGRARRKWGAGVVVVSPDALNTDLASVLHSPKVTRSTDPFFLVLDMPSGDMNPRLSYLSTVRMLLRDCLQKNPDSRFGVALDFSRTEMAGSYAENAAEISEIGLFFRELGVPVALCFSVLFPPDLASDAVRQSECDVVFVSPWLPWQALSEEVRRIFFQRTKSPFDALGSGFVAGTYSFVLVSEWVKHIRRQGVSAYVAAGGALSPENVQELSRSGAQFVLADSVAYMVRPWNTWRIRRAIKTFFS